MILKLLDSNPTPVIFFSLKEETNRNDTTDFPIRTILKWSIPRYEAMPDLEFLSFLNPVDIDKTPRSTLWHPNHAWTSGPLTSVICNMKYVLKVARLIPPMALPRRPLVYRPQKYAQNTRVARLSAARKGKIERTRSLFVSEVSYFYTED